MKWVKCRDPEEWYCDVCNKCGGDCSTCTPRDMYHKGPEMALCVTCFEGDGKEILEKRKEQGLDPRWG